MADGCFREGALVAIYDHRPAWVATCLRVSGGYVEVKGANGVCEMVRAADAHALSGPEETVYRLDGAVPKRDRRLVCPVCSSPDVVAFLYGEPSNEGQTMIERGERALGGCVVSEEAPAWKCRACRADFGRLADVNPEIFNTKESS